MTSVISQNFNALSQQEINYIKTIQGQSNLLKNINISVECQLLDAINPDEYLANFELSEGNLKIDIQRSDFNGFRSGLNKIRRKIVTDQTSGLNLKPSVGFKHRGVIEGFYGDPWTHSERIAILDFLAVHDFNLFIVAPKDDPWQRFDWRKPFSTEKLEEFRQLQSRAIELGIDLAVCVSPGLSICYSDESDTAAIVSKFNQLNQIGIKTFGLLLDDIPSKLRNDEDIQAFEKISTAHAHLANSVFREVSDFKDFNRLIFCPLQYHGRGNEPYITELSSLLANEIELFWTGRQICSEYLDVSDAQVFAANNGRMPFYWDNYPVNDVAMLHQLHVGPIEKREVELHKYAAGYCANPMDRIEASKFALATIGEYLIDPSNYNPMNSWNGYIDDTFTDQIENNAIKLFFNSCFESCLDVDSAPDFNQWLMDFSFAWHMRDIKPAISLCEYMGSKLLSASKVLNSEKFSNLNLQGEISKWLIKFENTGHALKKISSQLNQVVIEHDGQIKSDPILADFIHQQKRFLANDPTRVFGDGLDMLLGELATELAVNS
jgi:hyaluronoglucosaminidase